MSEFFQTLIIVTSLGLIYITILGATASMFHIVPSTEQSETGSANDTEEAAETVILRPVSSVYIKSARDVFRHIYKWIGNEPTEYLILLLVTADNRLVAEIQCTDKQGGYVNSPNIAVIIQHCIQNEANVIFIAHNHPNGTIYPSMEDVYYTSMLIPKLQKAGIRLKDHIIVTQSRYYSIKDNDKFGVVFD